MNKLGMIAAIVLATGVAYAAGEAKAPKVIACENFNEFHDSNGVAMGVCGATKPGGKARIVRSYAIAKVINPSTDKAVSVLVGFQ